MEKLKAKHDHKLTDILKVAIFGLMLILPGLILLPSMLYYGVNEYATAPTEQVEKIEYKRVDFNQILPSTIVSQQYVNNGFTSTYSSSDNSYTISGTYSQDTEIQIIGANNTSLDILEYQHKYLVKISGYGNNIAFNSDYQEGGMNYGSYEFTASFVAGSYFNVRAYITGQTSCNGYINLIDLTQMFGTGNEPTVSQFLQWYPNDYYEYTTSEYQILEIPTGTYETYTDITSQIQYNWNSLWQQPLFSWTNYTILKQGLDNFTYVFGITQTSYINNLITYELIMVAIYIVIDIVLTLFKWLTHLIGEK